MSWSQWPAAGVAPPTVVQGPVINPAPNVSNPAASSMVASSQYTPEQWAQMQQHNWQQWAQWQQQFQQWQQQYGAEYQKSMTAMAQARGSTPTVPYYMAAATQPPLPTETKPPPPPDDSYGSHTQQSHSTQSQILQQSLKQQQPPLPQTASGNDVSSLYSSTQYMQPPPVLASNYSTAPPLPHAAPPKDQHQYNRNMPDDKQKFGRNQNFAPNTNNPNWQNQASRNIPPGVKRPFNQQHNERGDMKRNRLENQSDGNRWQGGNSRTQQWNDREANERNRWGDLPHLEEHHAQNFEGTNNQRNQRWGEAANKAPLQHVQTTPKNPDEPSEAEKKFDKQFSEWEAQFHKWKNQNANHPDKSQYQEYEKKWVTWRAQLLERREQMRRKRLGLTGDAPKIPQDRVLSETKFEGNAQATQGIPPLMGKKNLESSQLDPQVMPSPKELNNIQSSNAVAASTENKPPIELVAAEPRTENNNNKELGTIRDLVPEYTSDELSQTNDNSTGFLKATSSDGIPGLDLVKDEGKTEDSSEDFTVNEQKKKPDFEAISRGINSILGDQNLMSMLSLVSQSQSSQPTITNTQNTTVPVNKLDSPKFSPVEYGINNENDELSNQCNIDDQSRSSFNTLNESENFSRFNEGANASFHYQNLNVAPADSRSQDNFFNSAETTERGFNRFNKGTDNFNRALDNFSQQSNEFIQQSGDFYDDADNFNRGGTFNRGADHFSEGHENFNKGVDNFSRGQDNFNRNANAFGGKSNNPSKGPPSLLDMDFSMGHGNFRGSNSFNKSPDAFNRGSDNFKQGQGSNFGSGNFGGGFNRRGGGNFGRSGTDDFEDFPDNMNRGGYDNFNRGSFNKLNKDGPNNFNRGGFNNLSRGGPFNRGGSNNFNRSGTNNFNRGGPNSNMRGPDNFNQDADDFNGDRFDFNRDCEDNFQRGGTDNFASGSSDIFDRGSDNFNRRSSDNFNRGRNGLNRGASDNFQRDTFDENPFVEESGDFYQEPENFNRSALDFDRGPENFHNETNLGKRGPDTFDSLGSKGLVGSDVIGREQGNQIDNVLRFEPSSHWSEPNVKPLELAVPSKQEGTDEDLWKPSNVIDYDHKSTRPAEPDILLIPINMFDYRHKLLSRIPFPQRPKWLSESIKRFPEFDMTITRPFEKTQQITRFSSQGAVDSSRKFFDRDRTLNDDRDKKFNDWDRKSYDDRDRKGFDSRDRKGFEDQERKYFDNSDRDRKYFDERDRKTVGDRDKKVYDRDRKFIEEREKSFDEDRKDRKQYDDRDRKRYEDRDRKVFGNRDQKDRDDVKTFSNKQNDEKLEEFVGSTRSSNNDTLEESENAFKFKDQKNITDTNKTIAGKSNITLIDDLISAPGRFTRPPRIVIILRGPPGSGKSHIAKLIKDKEVENGGSAPRIICLDDYFMVEQDREIDEDGKKVKVKEMVYEYEECMEASYRQSLMKSFKKTITDGYFTFIIVDNINDKVKYFGEMWSFAKQNGFQVYICEMGLDVQACTKRNIHGRSEIEIERCVAGWESTPAHHPVVNTSSLLQTDNITEVEMEEVNSPSSIEMNAEEHITSKWDTFEYSVDNLAKLDGISKPLRPSKTMEDFLQLDEWTEPVQAKPGQKRVRWADLEEHKKQEKMRAIGFVVGHTNWDRMMDPTKGSSALTQTKYIDRYK